LNLGIYRRDPKKSNKKPMVETITRKTKGKAKERPKNGEATGTKEGRDIVPLAYIQDR